MCACSKLNNKNKTHIKRKKSTMATKMFPTYLNIGSKGPAVKLLQFLLMVQGRNPAIIPDGEYGEQTAKAVCLIQVEAGIEADGNFGPQTRAAFLDQTFLDVDEIYVEEFLGDTVCAELPKEPVPASAAEDADRLLPPDSD